MLPSHLQACVQGSPCALLYKMLTAGDYQARIAAIRMLQSLVHTALGEHRAAQKSAVALYGNGAILMYLKLRLQQLYIELPSPQAAQELDHVLQLLAFAAEGDACNYPPYISHPHVHVCHCDIASMHTGHGLFACVSPVALQALRHNCKRCWVCDHTDIPCRSLFMLLVAAAVN